MGSENSSKISDGIGKRIIENLKKQEASPGDHDEYIEHQPAEEMIDIQNEFSQENLGQDNYYETPDSSAEMDYKCEPASQEELNSTEVDYYCTGEVQTLEREQSSENQEVDQENVFGSDIDTLIKLISRLPSGVTKQTGALIIRQTMEAMGLSMNKVLGDAQAVQEQLENNIKNNINVMEEYRTKIKILEQDIQKFRKKAHELEDVISLFILSDEKTS